MKLVLTIPTPHPFELNQAITYAVEYESKEGFMQGLEAAWKKAHDEDKTEVEFFGIGIDMSDCTYTPFDQHGLFAVDSKANESFAGPQIFTLEEWWEREWKILNNRKKHRESEQFGNTLVSVATSEAPAHDDERYCTDCGESDAAFLANYSTRQEWKCLGCGRVYLWPTPNKE